MDSSTPLISPSQIHALLGDFFGEAVSGLTPVTGGEVAQTFSFQAAGGEYILRINPAGLGASFAKEAFIHQRFASPHIPVAPILKVERLGEHIYAISQKMPGAGLATLEPQEIGAVLPDMIRILYAIHTSDVSGWQGYGVFDDLGRGPAESWRASLASIMDDDAPGGFFNGWRALFDTSFLERDFFERVYQVMLGLLEHCPEERSLVHGDFGFNNVLAEQGKVTAVLDWINAQYGDFVYDIAWLDFWAKQANFPTMIQRYYAAQGLKIPEYRTRLAACQAAIGLNAMRFYAKVGNKPAYLFVRQALEENQLLGRS